MTQQMEPEVGVGGVGRGGVEVDDDEPQLAAHSACLVGALERHELVGGGGVAGLPEVGLGVPGIEHLAGVGDGQQSESPRGAGSTHVVQGKGPT